MTAPSSVFSLASGGLTGLGSARAVALWAASSGLSAAGALAVGVLLVSSAVRMWGNYHHRRALTRKREERQ